jgi:hypothetical protein
MKRKFPAFLAMILVSGAFFFSSCKAKVSTIGTLSITVMSKDAVGMVTTTTPIYLATSKANLDNKIYQSTGWLDANGSKIFRDLFPGYYWYKVEGWDDTGAAEVYAGVDASVILWLNSPSSSKNK